MSDPIELLERRVRAVTTGERGTSGLHFFCQIGGRYDDKGITTLQVSGSGWALLSWRAVEEADMYNFQFDQDEIERFYQMLLDYPFWRANPARRSRRDGEVNVHLRLSDQIAGTCNGIQFWTGDVDEFATLRELMINVGQLIDHLSDGEIPLVDFSSKSIPA